MSDLWPSHFFGDEILNSVLVAIVCGETPQLPYSRASTFKIEFYTKIQSNSWLANGV